VTDARLCACGCGTPLGPRHAKYASRTCTQRAHWANPEMREKRRKALRQAKARERLRHWLRRARVDEAWKTLTRTTDLSLLSRADQQRLYVTLARLVREQYQAGYRVGHTTGVRQARAGDVAEVA
jgi:hypothetical protein